MVIRRRNRQEVALIAASEKAGVAEIAHLPRSPKNAERLLKALCAAEAGRGIRLTVGQL